MDLKEIKKRYPDEKPVCFNYMQAREGIFSLCALVERQIGRIRELENKCKMATPSERCAV